MTKPIPALRGSAYRYFDEEALPSLSDYVRIENISPAFDPRGETVSETHAAVRHLRQWARIHTPPGTKISKLSRVENAPMLVIDIPGTAEGDVLFFGHLDKFPAAPGWDEGLGSYRPVIRDQKLFGRATSDGGFAPYSYLSAIGALAELGLPYPRCLIAVETSSKSHGIHLARYFVDLRARCEKPDLIISLDAGCGDYERLWYTTGYRGLIEGHLSVKMLEKMAHSSNSGLAPSALGIAFELLGRVCDLSSGHMKLDGFAGRQPAYMTTGGAETDAVAGRFFLDRAEIRRHVPGISDDPETAAMLPVWNASLNVAGIQGLSSSDLTGGVLPAEVILKIAVRTPPDCDCPSAISELEEALVEQPPYNAAVDFSPSNMLPGWHPGELPAWLKRSVNTASVEFFGKEATGWAIGGAYPEIEIIAQEFEDAPILMTGVMGPDANFHVADESLDLPAARSMTASIARILADLVMPGPPPGIGVESLETVAEGPA
jgi:acetylornithine deacetylase/succinyl-diaminopimelate desuccinylase-like protein